MVAMVHLLTPVDGYYTTFYNHIAMVLTSLRDPGKTVMEPHFILQGCSVHLTAANIFSPLQSKFNIWKWYED